MSGATVLLFVAATATSTTGLRIEWSRLDGAAACAPAHALRARVVDRLGWDPFAVPARVAIEAAVRRSADTWIADLHLRTPDGALRGVRTFTASSCADLEDAVVLTAALVASSPATLDGAPAPPDPNRAEPQPTGVRLRARPPPARAPTLRRFTSAGRAVLATGTLPEPAPGVDLTARSPRFGEHWALGLGLRFLPHQRVGDLGFGVTAGWAEVCGSLDPSARVAVDGCARIHAGIQTAVVYPTETLRTEAPGDYPWAAAGGAARLRAHVWGPLSAEVETELVVSLTRQRFLVENDPDRSFREAAVALHLTAGLGLAF